MHNFLFLVGAHLQKHFLFKPQIGHFWVEMSWHMNNEPSSFPSSLARAEHSTNTTREEVLQSLAGGKPGGVRRQLSADRPGNAAPVTRPSATISPTRSGINVILS